MGTPLSGALKTRELENLQQFPVYLQNGTGTLLLWNNYDPSVSVPVTSSDLERRGVMSQTLQEDLHNYAPTV